MGMAGEVNVQQENANEYAFYADYSMVRARELLKVFINTYTRLYVVVDNANATAFFLARSRDFEPAHVDNDL